MQYSSSSSAVLSKKTTTSASKRRFKTHRRRFKMHSRRIAPLLSRVARRPSWRGVQLVIPKCNFFLNYFVKYFVLPVCAQIDTFAVLPAYECARSGCVRACCKALRMKAFFFFLRNPLEVGELDMSGCCCQIFVSVFASLLMYLTVSPCRCTRVSLDENIGQNKKNKIFELFNPNTTNINFETWQAT